MPAVDWVSLRATTMADDQRAVSAQTESLSVPVRAVGKAYRTYNAVVAAQNSTKLTNSRYAVTTAAKKAMSQGRDELLTLRAYETVRFVAEVRHWEKTGETSDELRDLSGDFIDAIRRNPWCRRDGQTRELIVTDDVLRVLFKVRWNDIVGVITPETPEFALTVDENRVRHGFLIRHPFRTRADLRQGPFGDTMTERRRLASVDRLGKIDDAYPALLARGVVHFQAGSSARAASAFRSYLADSPDSPYSLRTQNYLKAALDKSNETGGI
jgi:hypothetical protein